MIKKIKSSIIPISLLFFVTSSFMSCTQIIGPAENKPQAENKSEAVSEDAPQTATQAEQFASLNVKINDSTARAINPTFNQSLINKITLSGSGPDTVSKEWTSVSNFESSSTITGLKTGNWTFTIECYIDSVVAFTDTVTKTLEVGANTISFKLKEAATGNGSVEITFDTTRLGADIGRVSKFDFYFGKLGATSGIESFSDKNFQPGSGFGYEDSVPCGVYIAKFVLKDSSGKILSTTMELVKVAPGLKTTGTVYASLNESYTITYNLNDGVWGGSFITPVSFTEYDNVTLPTASNISKTDYKFDGWYTNPSFSGDAITSWAHGEKTGNVTLYAKWIYWSPNLYVNATTGNDNNDGSSGKQFKTVQKAIDFIVDTLSTDTVNPVSGPYKINVTGTITASTVAKINTESALNISIIGLGAAPNLSTLKGNGSDSVVIVTEQSKNIELTLEKLVITGGNNSTSNGGGIQFNAGKSLTIKGCSISSNSVTKTAAEADNLGGGGGIFIKGVEPTESGETICTITESQISNNETTMRGGGICIQNKVELTLEKTSISENKATTFKGGGIYNGYSSKVIIKGCVIENNTAANGGGIYNNADSKNPDNAGLIEIKKDGDTSTQISGNKATENGGGIYLAGGNSTITGAIIGDSSVTAVADAGYSNSAKKGGGLYIEGKKTKLTLDGTSYISYNKASDSGSCGGGIAVVDGAELIVNKDVIIQYNSAVFGGGVYATTSNSSVFNTIELNGAVQKNQASTSGGGMYLSNVNVTMNSDGKISSNNIKGDSGTGGGIHLTTYAMLTLKGGEISGNSAKTNGGAIYFGNGTLTIDGSVLIPDGAEKQNDVFLNGNSISLTSEFALKDESKKITITPKTYASEPTVLTCTGLSQTMCDKFVLSDSNYTIKLDASNPPNGIIVRKTAISPSDASAAISSADSSDTVSVLVSVNSSSELADLKAALTSPNGAGSVELVLEAGPGFTEIGQDAFRNCSKLKSVEISEGIITTGSNSFYNCANLETVVLPSTLTNIGSATFSSCPKLKDLEIPASVTNISSSVFYGCTALTSIKMLGSMPPTINGYTFAGNSVTTIYIPKGSLNAYQTAFGSNYKGTFVEYE